MQDITVFQILLVVSGLIFSIFMGLYGRRILEELKGVRQTLVKFQITSEQRLTRLEVKVESLEHERG